MGRVGWPRFLGAGRLAVSMIPALSVLAMAAEPQVQFGTGYGLNRYDGYNFKVFVHDPRQPDSIGGNFISALFKPGSFRGVFSMLEDRHGNLWIGSFGLGLLRLDPHWILPGKRASS